MKKLDSVKIRTHLEEMRKKSIQWDWTTFKLEVKSETSYACFPAALARVGIIDKTNCSAFFHHKPILVRDVERALEEVRKRQVEWNRNIKAHKEWEAAVALIKSQGYSIIKISESV